MPSRAGVPGRLHSTYYMGDKRWQYYRVSCRQSGESFPLLDDERSPLLGDNTTHISTSMQIKRIRVAVKIK